MEIIVTAAVTLLIVIMAQLAWAHLKYKAKLRKRRIKRGVKRRFGTQTHRVWPHHHKSHRYVTVSQHQQQLHDQLHPDDDHKEWERVMNSILGGDNDEEQPEYNVMN